MERQPTPKMVERAAEWAALIDDEGGSEEQRRACADWCAEDPRHRLAFERIAGISARFDALDPAQKRTVSTTSRTAGSKRRIVGGLTAVVLVVMGGWATSHSFAIRALLPDHSTAVGEQRRIDFADGSELFADTGTAFDSDGREIALFKGRVMARVASASKVPFVIETVEGTATALGTVYSAERKDGATIVTVIESRVRLCPAEASCKVLSAGQRAAMTATGLGAIESIDPATAGLWATGWIEVSDRPLPEVLAELARYRTAPIRFDAAGLAHIHVTGSYPLTDPDAALRSIAGTTGVGMHQTDDGALIVTAPGH